MTESERIEFEDVRTRLEDAISRLSALEMSSAMRASYGNDGGGRQENFINLDADYPVKPFTIHQNDEPDYDNFKMYVPDGCVLYGGVAVPVQGKDGEGWLDLGNDAEGNTYYGHVIPDANGNPDHVEVNTSATASGALASFKIAYVGTSDGGDVQLANGIVSLGGGGGGGTSGYNEPISIVTHVTWSLVSSNYQLNIYRQLFTFENGLLKTVGSEVSHVTIGTTEHSSIPQQAPAS